MTEDPWLTIIGLGEDGPDGLPPASRAALEAAEVVIGPPRHLALTPGLAAERIDWPVPFADGLPLIEARRGRRVVALASGDPFWFGAGSMIARHFAPSDWRALPGPSTFSLAAARLGWPLERTICLGLHAAPFSRLRPHLSPGMRAIVTLRDGAAVKDLAAYLQRFGFGPSKIYVMEALGGLRERVTRVTADALSDGIFAHPVSVAVEVAGDGIPLTTASGQADAVFETDGVMTKRAIRAVTLSTLAPRPGERLWDIGAGSGSVALEWLMSHPMTEAVAIEARADRARLIRANAEALGVERLRIVEGAAPAALADLPPPDAVFVGGGLSEELMDTLRGVLGPGTRFVANAVTLETGALLTRWHAAFGGALTRIALSEAVPLGRGHGWSGAYPVVQWSTTL